MYATVQTLLAVEFESYEMNLVEYDDVTLLKAPLNYEGNKALGSLSDFRTSRKKVQSQSHSNFLSSVSSTSLGGASFPAACLATDQSELSTVLLYRCCQVQISSSGIIKENLPSVSSTSGSFTFLFFNDNDNPDLSLVLFMANVNSKINYCACTLIIELISNPMNIIILYRTP